MARRFFMIGAYFDDVRKAIESGFVARSCWDKGVKSYALQLCDICKEYDYHELKPFDYFYIADDMFFFRTTIERLCLNGCDSWYHYSMAGDFCNNYEAITKKLCTPSERKRFKNGKLPLKPYYWDKVQTRALMRAFEMVYFFSMEISLDKYLALR